MATDRWDDEPGGDRGRRGPRGGDPSVGREKVKTPGLLLLLYGLFSLALGVASLGLYVAAPHVIARPYHEMLTDMMKGVPQQPGQPPPVPPYEDFERQMKVQGVIFSIPVVVGSLLTVLGGIKMRSATGRGLAMTGSILAMIPFTSSCCILGLPLGIWGVVVLTNPDAKAAFAASARGRNRDTLDDEGDRWS